MYTKRSALSCTFSNFFEFLSVQKCQTKGQIGESAGKSTSLCIHDYTSSYINLLEKALVPSLQIRRIRTMALETYKTNLHVFVKSLLPNRKYLKFIWISLHFVTFKPINKNI
jgi:uncharacterized protein YcbX